MEYGATVTIPVCAAICGRSGDNFTRLMLFRCQVATVGLVVSFGPFLCLVDSHNHYASFYETSSFVVRTDDAVVFLLCLFVLFAAL